MLRSVLVVSSLILVSVVPSLASAGDSAQSEISKREAAVRSRGRFFSKVALDRNYSGEWVIARTSKTTAFLDITDRRHPRTRATGAQEPGAIHILVVPNKAREHIAKTLGASITESDLKAALDVFHDAKKLARRLGIKKPKIYSNSESRVGVGYLHVHLEGQIAPKKKLPRIAK